MKTKILIIMSGEYVDGELASEFGPVPPSLLPIGNKCLYEWQISWGKKNGYEKIAIALPENYILGNSDEKYLKEKNIVVTRIPEKKTLGNAIEKVWNELTCRNYTLSILLGDTYFLKYKESNDENIIKINKNTGYYTRAIVKTDESNNLISIKNDIANYNDTVISGFFKLEEPEEFISYIKNNNNFIDAIYKYSLTRDINLCNKGIWLDFGHVTSYYRSKARSTTERVFNSLYIDNYCVAKSSTELNKMQGEFEWFQKIPATLKKYTPKVYTVEHENNSCKYTLEYVYASSLSELFVFSKHTVNTWNVIFDEINNFLDEEKHSVFEEKYCLGDIEKIYEFKTIKRLNLLKNDDSFGFNSHIRYKKKNYFIYEILNNLKKLVSPVSDQMISIIHGDLCFSNILFGFRSQNIKLIDPRGIDINGNPSIIGDFRYDIAKLSHSVLGLYDFIIAKKYFIIENEIRFDFDENIIKIQELFIDKVIRNSGFSLKEIMAINVYLFLSMLPLHSDDKSKQKALLFNAIRIYQTYIEE